MYAFISSFSAVNPNPVPKSSTLSPKPVANVLLHLWMLLATAVVWRSLPLLPWCLRFCQHPIVWLLLLVWRLICASCVRESSTFAMLLANTSKHVHEAWNLGKKTVVIRFDCYGLLMLLCVCVIDCLSCWATKVKLSLTNGSAAAPKHELNKQAIAIATATSQPD